jgi:uncharacterized repeat protein (TIGR01451 family)
LKPLLQGTNNSLKKESLFRNRRHTSSRTGLALLVALAMFMAFLAGTALTASSNELCLSYVPELEHGNICISVNPIRDDSDNLMLNIGVDCPADASEGWIELEFNQKPLSTFEGASGEIQGGRSLDDLLVRLKLDTGGVLSSVEVLMFTYVPEKEMSEYLLFETASDEECCNVICTLSRKRSDISGSAMEMVESNDSINVDINVGSIIGNEVEFTTVQARTAVDLAVEAFESVGGGTVIDGCMNDVYDEFGQGGVLNCNANDVEVGTVINLDIIDDGCAYPGDTVTFGFTAQVVLTAQARHDIGIFFAIDGDGNGDGALTGQCSISTPPYSGTFTRPDPPPALPSGSFVDLDGTGDNTKATDAFGYCADGSGNFEIDLDGFPQACNEDSDCSSGYTCQEFGDGITVPIQDVCGDIDETNGGGTNGGLYVDILPFTAVCTDSDHNGQMDLPYCTSWRQPGANDLCLTPRAAFPGAPSKCKCEEGFDIPIYVPGQIIVDKVTVDVDGNPLSGNPTLFYFEISGPDPDLPVDFSLTGDDDPYVSPGLIGNNSYTVTEFLPSGWELFEATCDDGSDPSSIDLQDGEIVKCTFTNKMVVVPPIITVVKTADPTSIAEPGGNVNFTVTVTNTSISDATLDSLYDDVFGDLNGQGTCLLTKTLASNGGSYICSFSGEVSGDAGETHTDTVTATASNEAGSDTASDDADVTINDVLPTVDLTKSANPISLDEPGGDFLFTVTIHNTSVEEVTITALTDSQSADAIDFSACAVLVGTTLAPDALTACQYTVNHTNAGTYENTASVTIADNEGNNASDTDNATVIINNVPPDISITKTVDPTSVPETGADVTLAISTARAPA